MMDTMELPLPNNKKTVLYAEFYMRPIQNKALTEEEGRPIFEDCEYVKIMVPGDKSSVVDRPVRLGRTAKHDNVQFADQYAAFKRGQTQMPTGTPLSEWPLISASQVKELEYFNVKTVEQLAEMPDTHAQNFHGIMNLKRQAVSYLERAQADAPNVQLNAAIQKKDEQLEALQNQMAEMAEELKELKKPKRGRPAKSDD